MREVSSGEERRERICEAAQAACVDRRAQDEPEAGELESIQPEGSSSLMRRVLERDNLVRALRQVQRNKGAPGVDGMAVDELSEHLRVNWESIRSSLEAGRYRPQPVRRVVIPKPGGGERKLGIPTVQDRFVQQAIAQVLQSEWSGVFHDASYGFRPGHNAHQALRRSQTHIRSGRSWVVDCDLESFFDRVNHDRLMNRLKHRVGDRALLLTINRFLKAGVEVEGVRRPSQQGVPQGGPLSPVLSNIVLDELDWELARRGHCFVRYADDVQVYVRSREAGERVMLTLTRYIEESLRLTVNARKSAVGRPWERSFLGFTFTRGRGWRLKVAETSIEKLKARVRGVSGRTRGHSVVQVIADLRTILLGWRAYFGLAEVLSPLRDLDKWVRRRLRSYQWKQWGRTGWRQLLRRGVDAQLVWNTSRSAHGPWRLSASPALAKALPNRYFTNLGLPELAAR